MERKGSSSSPKEPTERKGSKSSPKEPTERKGSSSSPKEPTERKGSKSSPKEPTERRGSSSSPEEQTERKGSKSSPKEPTGSSSSPKEPTGSKSSPKEPTGSSSSPEEPTERKGSKSSPTERKGSESSPKEPRFAIRCLGNEIAHMDLRCFYQSGRLYDKLEVIDRMRKPGNIHSRFPYLDARDICSSPIKIQSPKHIVEMVNELCIELSEIMKTYGQEDVHLLSQKLDDFNCKFLRSKPLDVLVQLLNASSQLKIKILTNLVCLDLLVMHGGEFADGILFNMPVFNMPILYMDPHHLIPHLKNLD